MNQREKDIMDAWRDLQKKAADRKKKLADAEEQQRFKEQARDLVSGQIFPLQKCSFPSVVL